MLVVGTSFSKWGFAYRRKKLINVGFLACLITFLSDCFLLRIQWFLKGINENYMKIDENNMKFD